MAADSLPASSACASPDEACHSASISGTMGEMVGRASLLIPASFSMRSRGSSGQQLSPLPLPPPPVTIPVRLLNGGEVALECAAEATLDEVQRECEQMIGVPPLLQRFCVQGAGGWVLVWGASLLRWECW